MRAAVFHSIGRPLSIERIDDPKPGDEEVIIRVSRSGICGSDLHMTALPRVLSPGTVLGHEFSGEIADVGRSLAGKLKVGQRVTALPYFSCGGCQYCDARLPALCASHQIVGVAVNRRGAYAQYVAAKASMVQRVPDGVSDDEAAMIEPLAVGYHIAHRAVGLKGAAVLVLGGGPIGASAAMAARIAGAEYVVVSEPAEMRRSRCLMLGATNIVDPSSEVVAQRFEEITGRQPDIVLECAGRPGMLAHAIEICATGGQVIIGTVGSTYETIPADVSFLKEVKVYYSNAYSESDFAMIIDFMAKGRIDASPMHTATIRFDELPRIFERMRDEPAHCKVLVSPWS